MNGRHKSLSPRVPTHTTQSPAAPESKTTNNPARKTKLSGTTMNMRFMMRQQAKPEMDHGSDTSSAPMAVESIQTHSQPQHRDAKYSAAAGEESVFINVLGRRSFGGFNCHAENAWNEHASFYGTNNSGWHKNDLADLNAEAKRKRKRRSR